MNLTKTLAVELAPEVQANCILPGALRTDTLARLVALWAGDTKKGFSLTEQKVPIGPIVEPDDIANGALYVVSNELASFVTSAIHEHDGGDAAR